LPLTGNNAGDQAFATDTDILYIWDGSAWQQAGASNSDDLTEGSTNLFFTNARADARIALQAGASLDLSGKSTTDLTEGTNLYYTDARVSSYLSSNDFDTATNIVASITDSAPGTLDTLNELAAALGDDPNFATTTANNIATKLPLAGGAMTGAITTNSTFDGRDVATDGAKLDGIEANADVTDTANVTAAGALMDSEVTNLNQVKAFDSSDYATAAQGTLADNALPLSGGTITGNVDVSGTIKLQGINRLNLNTNGSLYWTNTGNIQGVLLTNGSTEDINIKTNQAADVVFWTSGENRRMTIAADGNIGIGITDPQYQLHVKGNGDIKIEDDAGGSAHLRIGASTSGTRDSEWKVKVSGSLDEFQIDHDYTAGGVSVGETAFKLGSNHSIYNKNDQPTIRPTLNLDFANSKQLDPRITFYRDSIATYYDSKGVLRYANVNEPRFDHDPVTGESKGLLIEEARQNLQKYSYHMNGGSTPSPNEWDNVRAGVVTNMGIAPDRSYQANYFYANSGSNTNHYLREYFTGLTAGDIYTYSMYVKKGSIQYCQLEFLSHDGASAYTGSHQYFDLTDGTKDNTGGNVNPIDSTITPVGNDWYRKTLTGAVASGHNQLLMVFTLCQTPNDITFVGDYSDGMYVWGAQMEKGSFATSYVPSDTRFTSRSSVATYYDETGIIRTAPINSPRYGYKYNGRKWVETGLILEGSATNSIQNFFSNAGALQWSSNQRSEPVATSSVTAPDGSTTAFKQEINTVANGIHSIYDYGSVPVGQQLCFSVYAKAAEYDRIYLYTDGIVPTIGGIFYNLLNGTISGGPLQPTDSYGIENVGDGWYRCWFSGTPTSGSSAYFHIDIAQSDNSRTFVGTVGEGVYLWGPQREYAASPSSYIYTDTGNVTRSADVASSVAYTREHDDAEFSDISDWYDSTGTLYVDFNMAGDTAGSFGNIVQLVEDPNIRTGILSTNASNSLTALAYRAPDLTYPTIGALTYGTSMKATQTTPDGTNFITSVNGATAVTTSATAIVNPTSMYIGKTISDNYNYTGTFSKIAYYPAKLSNAELQALTENN